jgi:16S rRNA (uracil1498-N3)-methyltransferase
MHRFFVQPQAIKAQEARIGGEVAHQISRVLRMQVGDEICLLDGSGYEYRVSLLTVGANECVGRVNEKAKGTGEPRCQVTLYISLLNKVDKFEWALQKCTEIGAARFVPVRSARSISDTPGGTKIDRWKRIIQEAAEQSGRAIIPTLAECMTLQAAIRQEHTALGNSVAGSHIALFPTLGAQQTLKDALQKATQANTLAIFIGPEGGFTQDEVNDAMTAGIQAVTLGPRTLRAETAAVASLAMTLYELGEM